MIKPLFQRIVVAINGSEQSIHAAMYGIIMAKMYNCQMKAVYVVDTSALRQLTLSKFFVAEESNFFYENLHSDGKKYLDYVTDLALSKNVKIQTELREGAIWSEIIKAADEFKANLILLGGRENGSVSLRTVVKHDAASATNIDIVSSANCNVLIVREAGIEKLFRIA